MWEVGGRKEKAWKTYIKHGPYRDITNIDIWILPTLHYTVFLKQHQEIV